MLIGVLTAQLDTAMGLGLISVMLLVYGAVYAIWFDLLLTALRQFLAQATARLQETAQVLKPAAEPFNTWCTILVVLQILSLLISLPSLLIGADAVGPVGGLLALLLLGTAALYILPLLATGRFALGLVGALESGQTPTANLATSPISWVGTAKRPKRLFSAEIKVSAARPQPQSRPGRLWASGPPAPMSARDRDAQSSRNTLR